MSKRGIDDPSSQPADPSPTDLDPPDWPAFRAQAHRVLDRALDELEHVRDRPVWRPVPAAVREALAAPLPLKGEGEAAVCEAMLRDVLPYNTGNTHPGFFGWVHGAGMPMGVVAELVAAAMNSNVGGRQHGAVLVERQVLEWCRELFAFPEGTSGLLVSGTSMATLVALAVARHRATGGAVRLEGVQPGLVGYTSTEGHSAIAKAFAVLGLGEHNLRRIPTDAAFRIDIAALSRAVAADRAEGRTPFCVIGTAGTVNTGAIDDLDGLAALSAREGLWFHVDGAFGALAAMSPRLRPLLGGIERADSLAFDFHKWAHVPYDAGCVLVRDGALHRAAFGGRPEYLASRGDGLAGGEPWFCDFGPELSRGFRALKVWAALKAHGIEALGRSIEANCDLVAALAKKVRAHPRLELMAPPSLSIACLRFAAPVLSATECDALNARIVAELQDGGVVAPSSTTLPGGHAIRVNITNHRTTMAEIDRLIDEVDAAGQRALAGR